MNKRNHKPKRQNHLILMAKTPKQGLVKTRLAHGIGWGKATHFYRHTTTRLITQLSQDPRWLTCIAITPDANKKNWPWPLHVRTEPQGPGDLGARMTRLFKRHAPNPTLIIGTDIPEISATAIQEAFKALNKTGFVLGPSGDGGYWCVGQNNSPTPLNIFHNVRWSTEHTLKDTTANIPPTKLTHLTYDLQDIDTKQDFTKISRVTKNRWIRSN